MHHKCTQRSTPRLLPKSGQQGLRPGGDVVQSPWIDEEQAKLHGSVCRAASIPQLVRARLFAPPSPRGANGRQAAGRSLCAHVRTKAWLNELDCERPRQTPSLPYVHRRSVLTSSVRQTGRKVEPPRVRSVRSVAAPITDRPPDGASTSPAQHRRLVGRPKRSPEKWAVHHRRTARAGPAQFEP